MHRFLVLSTFLVVTCAGVTVAAAPPADDALTENAASLWDADASSGSSAVYDDTSRVQVGSSSLRFETDSGFDTWLWSPVARNANWDFTDVAVMRFWVYAENPSPYNFQNNSPWIRLGSSTGYWQYQTNSNILTGAVDNWIQLSIPIAGDGTWLRSQVGSVNITDIDYIEIHADTWDQGFTLWFDGFEFISENPSLPAPQNATTTPFYSTALIEWDAVDDPSVTAYEIYRRTATGSYGQPIKRVHRTYVTDCNLTPGETYYYKIVAINGIGLNVSQYSSEVGTTLSTNDSDLSTHKNMDLLVAFYTGGYTTAEVDQMVAGLQLAMDFYWRTTDCVLNMDTTWMFIDTEPPGDSWYNAALQNDLRNRGVDDDQYDLAFLAGRNLAGCFGGYVVFGSTCASLGTTCGVAYPGLDPDINYTIPWTFTHEIHHALETMENITNNTPEVLFCHFPWAYPDPLGPTGWTMDWAAHFDGISETNRDYGSQWMLYPAPYDSYIECVDIDNDGMPDDDSRVWMDEARFGTTVGLADTDADNLSDRQEYSRYNFKGTNPINPDTDGDGIIDGNDFQPLYKVKPFIPRMSTPPTIDGVIDDQFQQFTDGYYFSHNLTPFVFRTYAGWDDDAIYLAFETTRRLRFMLSIDGSGEDGRFASPVRHTAGATDTNNSDNKINHIGDSWGDGNHIYFYYGAYTASVAGRSTITDSRVRSTYTNGRFCTEVKIPRQLPGGAGYTWYPTDATEVDGLTLTDGNLIGLCLTVSNYSDSSEGEFTGTWTSLFETHSYVDVSLRTVGDMNCDGTVDVFDIDPFVSALVDNTGYANSYPDCDAGLADCNSDGVVDVFDIDPFVSILVSN